MCVNFKSRHFSNYTIFRLENLFKNEPTLLIETTIKKIGVSIWKSFNLNRLLDEFSLILLLYSDSTSSSNAIDNAVSLIPISMLKKFNIGCLEMVGAKTIVSLKYISNTQIGLYVYNYNSIEENDVVEIWAI